MKERPILLNAPMVRAVLDGNKMQTRRVAKLTDAGHIKEPRGYRRWHPADPEARLACPYGQPGDRLWVREAWLPMSFPPIICKPDTVCYRADKAGLIWNGQAMAIPTEILSRNWGAIKWKPSIHMPRWASRILLEIVSVHVERLADISEADAIAEGVDPALDPLHCPVAGTQNHWRNYQAQAGSNWEWSEDSPIKSFQTLWQQLEGPCIWLTNPWVWVIEFKRVTV